MDSIQKLQELESKIDRSKVNKNSNFNIHFKDPQHRNINCDIACVSAELYTREEAAILLKEFYIAEVLGSDYEGDADDKEYADSISAETLQFGYVHHVVNCHDIDPDEAYTGRTIEDINPENRNNLHKPIYYVGYY